MTARTFTLTNRVEVPGPGEVADAQEVTIRLNALAFTGDGTTEKVPSRRADVDPATGVWSAVLEINDDLDPAGTSYTVREGRGRVWSLRPIVAADAGQTLHLRDVLAFSPSNPGPPLVVGVTAAELAAAIAGVGGGGGAVDSVNDQTGDVVLDAGDVGADVAGAATAAQTAAISAAAADATTKANAAQAYAIQRANHTGTQAAGTITGLATVATTGAYADLAGKPTLGTAAAAATTDFDAAGAAATAQAAAVAASQPVDSDLTAIAALTTTTFGRSLLTQADAAATRTTFGLGTAATTAASAYDTAGAASTAQAAAISAAATDATTKANAAAAASQPLDSDLTAIAALTTTSFGRSFLALADAAAGRTLLGLGTAATTAASAYEVAGAVATETTRATTAEGLKLAKASNLSDVASASTARTNLGLGTAATVDTGTASGNVPLLGTGGVLAIGRLATGTPDGTKYVRDDGTLAVPAGSGSFPAVKPSTGEWVTSQYGTGNSTDIGSALNDMIAMPIYIGQAFTVAQMDLTINTALATAVHRLGIYNSAASGRPGTLVLDAGTVDSSTTGVKALTVSQALSAGMYWLVAVPQTALARYRGFTNVTGYPLAGASNLVIQTVGQNYWRVQGVTSALPSSPTWAFAGNASASNIPIVGLVAA